MSAHGDRFVLLIAVVGALITAGIEAYVFIVAYPLLRRLEASGFGRAHAFHVARITAIVAPPILATVAANTALLATRPTAVPLGLVVAAVAAGIAVLTVTAIVQVPLHATLTRDGHHAQTLDRLVRNEWMRALAIFLQATIDVWMIWLTLVDRITR